MTAKRKLERWQKEERLQRSLHLTDAIADYADDCHGNSRYWVRKSWQRLEKQFGLKASEIQSLMEEYGKLNEVEITGAAPSWASPEFCD